MSKRYRNGPETCPFPCCLHGRSSIYTNRKTNGGVTKRREKSKRLRCIVKRQNHSNSCKTKTLTPGIRADRNLPTDVFVSFLPSSQNNTERVVAALSMIYTPCSCRLSPVETPPPTVTLLLLPPPFPFVQQLFCTHVDGACIRGGFKYVVAPGRNSFLGPLTYT